MITIQRECIMKRTVSKQGHRHGAPIHVTNLLGIKYQGPDLNGLPLGCVWRACVVLERRVRRQARLIDVRVEALDKSDFVWGLVGQVVPLVSGIVFDAERGAFAMGVDVAS
jgi:hypothetical protein